jgi:demethylspheroidene O-methyltransferase
VALPEGLIRFRNRLLSNSRVLEAAQRTWLGRWIARRKSIQLYDIIAGFTYTQCLLACAQLNVLEHIGLEGCTDEALSERTGLPKDRCRVLIRSALALDILTRVGSKLHLGRHGAALVAQPWILQFVAHHNHFYRDLLDPVALLQAQTPPGALRSYWAYENDSADKTAYTLLMQATQRAVADQVLGAYNFKRHRQLLDVGGGTGAFAQAVGERYQELALHVFDLPTVASMPAAPGKSALTRHAGDFRNDPLPGGMDIITLVRVVHDHDDHVVKDLLRKARGALAPRGTLLIAEPFSGRRGTAKVADSYFGFYFLAMGQGRIRTPGEIAHLASGLGFSEPVLLPTSLPAIVEVMTLTAI